jgi:diketogulonate reductase-like aldo/keto reductase
MGEAPKIKLNNGVEIPQVGFGVYQIPRSKTIEIVREAFDVGYRLIDTAEAYGNEKEVGQAVIESGLDREALFITTKLQPQSHGRDSTIAAFEESLRSLRMEYIDLYLLHWPSPFAPSGEILVLRSRMWKSSLEFRNRISVPWKTIASPSDMRRRKSWVRSMGFRLG